MDINFRDVLEAEGDEGIDVTKMSHPEDSKSTPHHDLRRPPRQTCNGQVGEALSVPTARARGIGGGVRANASDATGGLAAIAGKGTLVAYSTGRSAP